MSLWVTVASVLWVLPLRPMGLRKSWDPLTGPELSKGPDLGTCEAEQRGHVRRKAVVKRRSRNAMGKIHSMPKRLTSKQLEQRNDLPSLGIANW